MFRRGKTTFFYNKKNHVGLYVVEKLSMNLKNNDYVRDKDLKIAVVGTGVRDKYACVIISLCYI